MGSKYCCHLFHSFHTFPLFIVFFVFIESDAVLNKLGLDVPPSGCHMPDTSDTSGDESKSSQPRQRLRSDQTYKMNRVWWAEEMGRFFVTCTIDANRKPSHFYCCVYSKDVSVLTHGLHEILRQFQGAQTVSS